MTFLKVKNKCFWRFYRCKAIALASDILKMFFPPVEDKVLWKFPKLFGVGVVPEVPMFC